MAKFVCIFLSVAFVALLSQGTQARPGLEDFLPEILGVVKQQFVNGQTDFLGYNCIYTTKPTFRRWELYFHGKFWCPGLASFTGRSLTRSKSGAIEAATRDFAKKALEHDLFTKEELKLWI